MDNLIELIDSDITWHKEHRCQVSEEYADAFIKGLEQAKLLLKEAHNVMGVEGSCSKCLHSSWHPGMNGAQQEKVNHG